MSDQIEYQVGALRTAGWMADVTTLPQILDTLQKDAGVKKLQSDIAAAMPERPLLLAHLEEAFSDYRHCSDASAAAVKEYHRARSALNVALFPQANVTAADQAVKWLGRTVGEVDGMMVTLQNAVQQVAHESATLSQMSELAPALAQAHFDLDRALGPVYEQTKYNRTVADSARVGIRAYDRHQTLNALPMHPVAGSSSELPRTRAGLQPRSTQFGAGQASKSRGHGRR